MTDTTATSRIGNFAFPEPNPTQDQDLLAQLPFVPGLKELLTLRQVHALEHGTVWVLGELFPEIKNDSLGGLSTDQGFYLYGDIEALSLRRGVETALRRFRGGEWDLAVHPRCGTNLSVSLLLTAGLTMGTSLLLPKVPIAQLLGLGIAATTAAQLTPDLGSLAQRYVTTAIPFNLELIHIRLTTDFWGQEAFFVKLRWLS